MMFLIHRSPLKIYRFIFTGVFFTLLVFLSFTVKSQNNVTEQVEVKRQFKPVLGESLKIRKSPYFPEESPKAIQPSYGFKDISLKKDTASNSILADSLKFKDSTKILPIFMRAGAGTDNNILGEIYYNTLPSSKGSFSANFKHSSLAGKLKNQSFSSDQVNLDGKKIMDENYLSAHFGVEIKSDPFYGYDHSLYNFSSSAVKQDFQFLSARLEFAKIRDTAEGMHYYAKLGGYFLGDSYSQSESHFDFFGGLGYSKGHYGFNLKADIQNNILTTKPEKFNTSLARLKPAFTWTTDVLKLNLGLNIVYELGDRSQAYIFPDLSLDMDWSEDFNIYGGIKGDILQNTYRGLSTQNPYLLPSNGVVLNYNFLLQNTKESILIYAGIKGNINPDLDYKAQVDISQMDRVAFFQDHAFPNSPYIFTLAYDGNKTVITKIYGEINYLASDQFRLNANLTLLDYRLSSLPKPFYTPAYKLEAVGHYNPVKNWYFTGTLKWLGSQYVDISLSPGTPLITINPYFDLNLGIEYKVSKKLGVFIQGNNLFDKEYLLYYNYPVIGLNVLAGLSLRF